MLLFYLLFKLIFANICFVFQLRRHAAIMNRHTRCVVSVLCVSFSLEISLNLTETKYLVLSGLYVFRQGTNGQILPISASHLAAAKKGFRLRLKSVPKKAAPRY